MQQLHLPSNGLTALTREGALLYMINTEAYKRKIHKWFRENAVNRAKFSVSAQRFSAELRCPYISLVTVNSLLLKLHRYCAVTSRHVKSKKPEKMGVECLFVTSSSVLMSAGMCSTSKDRRKPIETQF